MAKYFALTLHYFAAATATQYEHFPLIVAKKPLPLPHRVNGPLVSFIFYVFPNKVMRLKSRFHDTHPFWIRWIVGWGSTGTTFTFSFQLHLVVVFIRFNANPWESASIIKRWDSP